MNSNPALGLIGFWMLLQLAATIAILLGGIYALYCLGRASAGLDRMATAMEEWVEQQRRGSTPTPPDSLTSAPAPREAAHNPLTAALSTSQPEVSTLSSGSASASQPMPRP